MEYKVAFPDGTHVKYENRLIASQVANEYGGKFQQRDRTIRLGIFGATKTPKVDDVRLAA
jgi:hypothetical protein